MFCRKCGAKLDDSALFCNQCGIPVSVVASNPAPIPPVAAGGDRLVAASVGHPLVTRMPLAGFVFAMLCTFLPFMNVSCAGNKVCSVSGVKLAAGFTPKDVMCDGFAGLAALDDGESNASSKVDMDEQHVDEITSVVILLAVVGLVLSGFRKRGMRKATFTAGILCAVASVADFIYLLDKSDPPLSVELGAGYILFFIAILVATASSYFLAYRVGSVQT